MARGRKQLPKEIKELQGTLRQDRVHADILSFTKITAVTDAPKELSKDEKRLYLSICNDLILAGVLENPDLDTVLKLVMENTRYYNAMKTMREKNSYVITDIKSGRKIINPLNTIANQALKAINMLSSELGLTPAARQRLKISSTDSDKETDDPDKDMKKLMA